MKGWRGYSVAILVVISSFLGGIVGSMLLSPGQVQAGKEDAIQEEVRTHKIVLVDDEGIERVILAAKSIDTGKKFDGVVMRFMDKEGKKRIQLLSSKWLDVIAFFNEEEKAGVLLGMESKAPMLRFPSHPTYGSILLSNGMFTMSNRDRGKLQLTVSPEGQGYKEYPHGLYLYDNDDNLRAALGSTTLPKHLLEAEKELPLSSLVLISKDKKVDIQAP
jgi:hypothetical protein